LRDVKTSGILQSIEPSCGPNRTFGAVAVITLLTNLMIAARRTASAAFIALDAGVVRIGSGWGRVSEMAQRASLRCIFSSQGMTQANALNSHYSSYQLPHPEFNGEWKQVGLHPGGTLQVARGGHS
jgi:hypothetical protein